MVQRAQASGVIGFLLLTGCLNLDRDAYQFTQPEPVDAGFDAGVDAGHDGGDDAGFDAGAPVVALLTYEGARNRIAAGRQHACVVRNDGGVTCWGSNTEGQVDWRDMANDWVGPSSDVGGPATAVACGEYHTCTINGPTVHCWGSNRFKQLGNPDSALYRYADHTFQLEPGAPAIRVMVGKEHSCIVNTRKDLLCWGEGAAFTTTTAQSAPTNVPTTVALATTAAGAGYAHTCFVSNGVTGCKRGIGMPAHPIPAFSPPPTDIFAGDYDSMCLRIDGGVQCQTFTKGCWLGPDSADAGYDYTWFPLQTGTLPVSMSLAIHNWNDSSDSTYWVDTAGEVWCLGRPVLPGTTDSCAPRKVVLPSDAGFVHVVSGERFACALSATGDVYCWGDGRYLLPHVASSAVLSPTLMLNIER